MSEGYLPIVGTVIQKVKLMVMHFPLQTQKRQEVCSTPDITVRGALSPRERVANQSTEDQGWRMASQPIERSVSRREGTMSLKQRQVSDNGKSKAREPFNQIAAPFVL